jgi:hypothetical protein
MLSTRKMVIIQINNEIRLRTTTKNVVMEIMKDMLLDKL